MASALAHDFVGFLAVFGHHNIRGSRFASKVNYSASPQTFAECSRSASCCFATIAMLLGQKRVEIFLDFEHPTFYALSRIYALRVETIDVIFVQTKHKYFLSEKFGLYWRLFNTACMGCLRLYFYLESIEFVFHTYT